MKTKPTIVLFDTRQRHWDQNPFISLLAASLPNDTYAKGFSWSQALLGRYDLVHLHWPEYLTKHNSWYLRGLSRLLTALWIVRIYTFKTPIVRTVHNKRPHDNLVNPIDSFLLNLLERRCRANIWMQEPALCGVPRPTDYSVIPHGDYRPWIDRIAPRLPLDDPASPKHLKLPMKLLCFGILKAYKNIEEPISAIRQSPDINTKFRIMGSAPDQSYIENLRTCAGADPRIEIEPGRVPDDQLISHILDSNYVIVPYPDLFNSGVVLLALSLGRPVVLRENPITRALREEFGSEWVHTYPDHFDRTVLESLFSAPPLEATAPFWGEWRSWRSIGQRHSDLYQQHLP